MSKKKQKTNREIVIDMFFNKKKSNKQISKKLDLSTAYISQVCSLERRNRRDAAEAQPSKERGIPAYNNKEKDIDWEMVDRCLESMATGEEVAKWLGMDYDTLASGILIKFDLAASDYFKQKREGGRMSLRRRQFSTAHGKDGEKPSPVMQIWLGKQHLGQKDSFDADVTVEVPKALGVKIAHVDAS